MKANQILNVRGKIVTAGILAVMLTACSISVFAAPKIKEASFEGKGRFEVDFTKKVQYKNVKVTVTDSEGNTEKAKITEKDDDGIDFVLSNWKYGKTYKYQISGIRRRGESSYGKIKGSVTIPVITEGIWIKEIEYDSPEGEIDVDFGVRVQWKNVKIKVMRGQRNYVKKVKEVNSKEAEIRVKKLTKGKTYRLEISGIRLKGAGKYITIRRKFIA